MKIAAPLASPLTDPIHQHFFFFFILFIFQSCKGIDVLFSYLSFDPWTLILPPTTASPPPATPPLVSLPPSATLTPPATPLDSPLSPRVPHALAGAEAPPLHERYAPCDRLLRGSPAPKGDWVRGGLTMEKLQLQRASGQAERWISLTQMK